MTEAQFSSIALKVCLSGLIIYMLWIIYQVGKESNAGRYGMMILFIALGAGFFSFVMKGALEWWFTR